MTCICNSFFSYWNDCQYYCQFAINFQWIKTRSISKAAAFCCRNGLNGSLYFTSIERTVGMSYVIILFSPVAKKEISVTYRFCKKSLKKTIFSPICSNFIYSFSLCNFPVFTIFFKEFEDRQYKLHALIKFFWFLIVSTTLDWGDQNNHEQNVQYISVISWILPISW